jgi:hypothetical protein
VYVPNEWTVPDVPTLLAEEALAGGRAIEGIDEEVASSGMNESVGAFIFFSHNGMPGRKIRKDPTLALNV